MERDVQSAVSALGCLDGDNYEKEPDCLETVKDLIRYLRRDAETSSFKIRHLLTSLNVIEKDLIPILRSYSDDAELFEATIRLLINLTQPLSERKTTPDDEENRDSNPTTVVSQRLRLIEILKRTKRAFADERFLTVIKEKLSKLLSLDWESREEEDRLLIERILILLRNILHIPAPAEDVVDRTSCDLTTHDKVIWVLRKCKLDEILLDLACAENQREFHVYVLEIVALILRQHAPEVLASTGSIRTVTERRQEENELTAISQKEASKKIGQLRRATGRHTSFAGAYTVHGVKGLNQDHDIVSPRPLIKPEDLTFDTRKHRRRIPRNRAPATETTADIALISSSSPVSIGRGSALEIRIILKEFCNRFVSAAYNKFMRSIQFALERRNAAADGGSRYHFWWLMRYLTAFVRHVSNGADGGGGVSWKHVAETLSIHCLHEAQTQLDECIDVIRVEKKEAKSWGRKAHVVLKAYGEILMMLQHLEKGKDEEGIDMAMEVKKTVFYVMEYREQLITLLKQYKPAVFTRSYLKDLVEITHVYLKMLETHCLVYGDELKVQKKRRRRRQKAKTKSSEENPDEPKGPEGLTEEEKRRRSEEAWESIEDELSAVLRDAWEHPEMLPKDAVAYDCLAEHGFDPQIVAQIRVQNSLKANDLPKAVALLRCMWNLWPDMEIFRSTIIPGPSDDLLVLRGIFFTEFPMVPGENDSNLAAAQTTVNAATNEAEPTDEADKRACDLLAGGGDNDSDSDGQEDNYVTSEIQFSFSQYVQRFAHSEILCWYIVLLQDFSANTVQLNHCLLKMLHRISYDLKMAPLIYQARLFRTFQKLLNTPGFDKSPGAKELIAFAKHFLLGFFAKANKNSNLFVEILFWKSFKEAYEIDYGYGSFEVKKKESKRKSKKSKDNDSSSDFEHDRKENAAVVDLAYNPPTESQSQSDKHQRNQSKDNDEAPMEGTNDDERPKKKKRKKRSTTGDDDPKPKRRKSTAPKNDGGEAYTDEAIAATLDWVVECDFDHFAETLGASVGRCSSPTPAKSKSKSTVDTDSSSSDNDSDRGRSPVRMERKRKAMVISDDED